MNIEQIRAKKLYAEGKSAEEIAKLLEKSTGTIYRWIKQYKEEFEQSRKIAQMTTDDMSDLLDEAHKKNLLEIIENPHLLQNPKSADALIKIANVLEKMDARKEREAMLQANEEEKGVVFIDDIKEDRSNESQSEEI
ncbi:helix-turn-helix domain-containing protein [Fusobacterium necrophorum]|uniref:Helix-turn-helix domain-containing protein n=1 Tax=Fusobacterium necrophorum TaxID=859 RepID=A0AAW6WE26_9FUSO|nr:helix-turn-helix domain-containing protein [Fusobacterium necrophorum]MDK4481702.1 helix-turn-helix domain-containing protein [Fusobacterium necrophorum]MDK4512767.1 helix-turn-helix domain-containing protein [Fusobacterium necrophorum]